MKQINRRASLFFAFVLVFSSLPTAAFGATFFMDPSKAEYKPGDTFTVKLRIDPQGDCINAVESGLVFPDNLAFVDFSTANSVYSLWIDKPSSDDKDEINTRKELDFSAGSPGGFCGTIEGDVGMSDIIAEAIFKVKAPAEGKEGENARLAYKEPSSALINDGQGTAAELFLSGASFKTLSASGPASDDWSQRIGEDAIPPENFVIEIQKDPSLFQGDYFVVFSTTDKQTGIDHYEILEASVSALDGKKSLSEKIGGLFGSIDPKWENAATPYRLKDQSLSSVIIVKAVDKAGNEREVKYLPETADGGTGRPWAAWTVLAVLILGLCGAAIVIVRIVKTIRRK